MEQAAHVEVTAEGTVRLKLAGPLIMVDYTDVLTRIEHAFKADPSMHLSVDLTEVTSLDSSGIALLLLVRRSARRGGKTFHLQGARPEVRTHLDVAGLTVFLGLQKPYDTGSLCTAGPALTEPGPSDGRRTALVEILHEPFDRHNLAAIRRLLSRHTAVAAMSEQDRYDLLLSATEMMTNSVRHGGGSGSVSVTGLDDLLFVIISDSGRGIPRRYRGPRPRPRPGHIGLYGL